MEKIQAATGGASAIECRVIKSTSTLTNSTPVIIIMESY